MPTLTARLRYERAIQTEYQSRMEYLTNLNRARRDRAIRSSWMWIYFIRVRLEEVQRIVRMESE